MKIDPEAAVKFEDGQRSVREIALRPGQRANGSEQGNGEEKKRESPWGFSRHSESHDSSAKFPRAQIQGSDKSICCVGGDDLTEVLFHFGVCFVADGTVPIGCVHGTVRIAEKRAASGASVLQRSRRQLVFSRST